jgi:hypothetical protein
LAESDLPKTSGYDWDGLKARKNFFFEKKKQKTFAHLVRRCMELREEIGGLQGGDARRHFRRAVAACALAVAFPAIAHGESGYGCAYIPPPPPQQTDFRPPSTSIIPEPYFCDKIISASSVAGCDKQLGEDKRALAKLQHDAAQATAKQRSPDIARTIQCFQLQVAWDRATRDFIRTHPQRYGKPRKD